MDPAYDCREVVEIEQEPRHHLIIANEFMRAFAVEIPPHDRTLCHRHPYDYLVYVASFAADIVSAPKGKQPETVLYGDGECELGKAGLVHVVENLRATPFRNLVIELLPRVGELRRGPAPQRRLPTEKPSDTVATPLRLARAPKAEVLPHFESNRIAVYRVDTDAGCETELTGPAIVASPYDSEIELEGPEGNQKLRHFCHLTWLAPSQKAILRGLGQAVVFQLGRRGEPHSSRLAETAATGPSQELATATSTVTMHRK